MEKITYRDLVEWLNEHPDKLDNHLTIRITDGVDEEFFPARLMVSGKENDVLDEGHPYLEVME